MKEEDGLLKWEWKSVKISVARLLVEGLAFIGKKECDEYLDQKQKAKQRGEAMKGSI